MKPYEILDSKLVFEGKILNIVHDTISLPDGRKALREVVVHDEGVTIMPVDNDGKLIFVRQYRHPVVDYVLEAPAGMMDEGEKPEECAVRELKEETGCTAGRLTFLSKMYACVGYCNEVLHVYMAEELTHGEQSLDEDEFVSVEKYSLEEAVEMIFDGRIVDSKTIAAVLCCKEILSKR